MTASTSDPLFGGGIKPGVFGPAVVHGKPRNGGPDWLRVGLMSVALVAVFAVAIAATYAAVVVNEVQQVGTSGVNIKALPSETFQPAPEADAPLPVAEVEALEDRTTILLVGSDSREGLTDEQLQAIGTEDDGSNLTDTIILLQIDPATDAAAMLSFPRDLLVERCDGTTGKINGAYYVGELQGEGKGPLCLVETIKALTRIEIDHYVRVNFAGFVDAVDAVGGVTFYLDEPIKDRLSGLDVPDGCVEFDGVQALQFVRARHIDSDFGRIARQQRFAREMLKQATSVGTLANPVRVTRLISSISEVLETDRNFGARQMADLVSSMENISSGAVDARTVPAVIGSRPGPEGTESVVRQIKDEAEALYKAFRRGDLLPQGVGTDGAPAEMGPENIIPILVRNGTDTEGLADETAEVLQDLGFTVGDTDTAEAYGFESSLVLYPSDRKDQAEVLSKALGDIPINAGNGQVDELTLILGGSFDPQEFAPEPDPGDELTSESEFEESSESESADDSDLNAEASESPTDGSSEEFTGAELSAVDC